MILTIKAGSKSGLKNAVFQASVIYGLDVEEFADGTFEVACPTDLQVQEILAMSNGSVIYQK